MFVRQVKNVMFQEAMLPIVLHRAEAVSTTAVTTISLRSTIIEQVTLVSFIKRFLNLTPLIDYPSLRDTPKYMRMNMRIFCSFELYNQIAFESVSDMSHRIDKICVENAVAVKGSISCQKLLRHNCRECHGICRTRLRELSFNGFS